MNKKPIMVIAGGTGFFGNYLINFFKNDYSLVVITRGVSISDTEVTYVNWDGKSQGDWLKAIDGAEVLINLSGKSINCKFTEENKKLLLSSRVDSTKALVEGVKSLIKPPKVFFNASAGAMYQLLDRPNDEFDVDFKNDFLSEMALEWEGEFFNEDLPETRRVTLRTSLVLGKNGGVYAVLRKLTKLYLGGSVGSGKQLMSWIHVEDAARAVAFIILNKQIKGPVNLSTIKPESNRGFMQKLRISLNVSFGFPVSAFGLKVMSQLINIEPSLMLNSVHFIPRKLMDNDFKFNYEKLEDALKYLS